MLNEAQKTDKSIEDILPAPQMLNGYSYVNNNPLKYIDPTGEFLFTATIDPTAEIPDIAFGQQYKPDEFSLLEKQVIITAGSLATFAPAIYNAGNIISDIGRVFIISKNIKNKIPQQKNSTIKISPDELTPTEKFDPDHLHVVQRKIENKGEFYTSKPVRYYENDGKKLIVDGHHRTQAAKNLKMDVYAKPVDAAYFKERFNANVDDFLGKAKDFINKSVKK